MSFQWLLLPADSSPFLPLTIFSVCWQQRKLSRVTHVTLGTDILMDSHWAAKKEGEIQGSGGIINDKKKKKTGIGVIQAHLNTIER